LSKARLTTSTKASTKASASAATDSRERALDVAEKLFAERGYQGITMRDIGDAITMKHASLYYHFAGGKEEIYIKVTERALEKHKVGLQKAIAEKKSLSEKLNAAARWFFSQPAMDTMRMVRADLPQISKKSATRLIEKTFESTMLPVVAALEEARANKTIRQANFILISGAFLSSIQALQDSHLYTPTPKETLARELIDVLLNGLNP
jgi:TetR/AcrR family transcriptional regulator, cholesterol catabolism regulator